MMSLLELEHLHLVTTGESLESIAPSQWLNLGTKLGDAAGEKLYDSFSADDIGNERSR